MYVKTMVGERDIRGDIKRDIKRDMHLVIYLLGEGYSLLKSGHKTGQGRGRKEKK